MSDILIPDDASIRLALHAGAWTVGICRPGTPSDIGTATTQPGTVSGLLTHDHGMAWPDRRGVALANALLSTPDAPVFLRFHTLADALECRRRLEGGGA